MRTPIITWPPATPPAQVLKLLTDIREHFFKRIATPMFRVRWVALGFNSGYWQA